MNNVLISYRIRLARNLASMPFPGRMSEEQAKGLLESASEALTTSAGGGEFTFREFTAPDDINARALMEEHLVSPEFFSLSRPRRVVLSRDRKISVMIGEEDHLRIQVFGKELEKAWEEAKRIDGLLDERLGFAFDETLGYLTACPTNLGTGLRASVLLHLPALTELSAMKSIISQASQLGMTVRGLYGEGTSARWGYYQISNQITLGVSEEDVISRLNEVTGAILSHELNGRAQLYRRDPTGMSDRVWRAIGLMSNARRISAEEAMEAIAILRLGGQSAGLHIDEGLTDGLLHEIQPAVIALSSTEAANAVRRDEIRADLLRRKIRGIFAEK